MQKEDSEHKVLILGGGFAGIKCALELQKKNLENVKITLVGDRPHFEYHGALYRTVAGSSPLEVCIPVATILDMDKVEFLVERISKIDLEKKQVHDESGSCYAYDTLVIALGAETNYFGIPGLEEHSHGMKTIPDALALKRHIQEVIESCVDGTKADKLCAGNFVVIGGGPTGVEVAGELAVYTKELAREHGLEPSLMSVELIEAGPRILPSLPPKFAKKIANRIRSLGVNFRLNRAIQKSDIENVYLRDMELKTKTVIWTAGVQANHLIKDAGLKVDRLGKAEVTQHMQAVDHEDVYLSGDAAATLYSGMAQTALYDGEYIANTIEAKLKGKEPGHYFPGRPIYAIPAGPGWAGTKFGPIQVYGKLGWFLRRIVDLVVYRSFLSPRKAYEAFSMHYQTCDVVVVEEDAKQNAM